MVVSMHGWRKCPPGELARLSSRLRARRLVTTVLTAAAAALAAAAIATSVHVATDSTLSWFGSANSGGCGCATTADSADACHTEQK